MNGPSVERHVSVNKFERKMKWLSSEEHYRVRISRWLDNGVLGLVLDILEAVVSVVFAICYVVNSYSPGPGIPADVWTVELSCALFFLTDLMSRGILLAESFKSMLCWNTFINCLVILPVYPAAMFVPTQYVPRIPFIIITTCRRDSSFWHGGGYLRLIYPIRFLKCSMEIRAVLHRGRSFMSPVMLFGLMAYFKFLSVIFVAAGVIQITETSFSADVTNDGDWTFFNSLFKSILTFVYVDYPPAENPVSKIIVGTLLVFLLIIIPYELSKLFDINSLYSSYEHDTYHPSHHSKHIVICGDLTPQRIEQCFWEVALLMDPFFAKRAVYIQGSVLDADAATRAACDTAAAIFVLTRKTGHEDVNVSDHRTIMRAIEVRQVSPAASIFVQIHLSTNRHLLEASGITNVLCISEVMHSLLAQNCFCPGFSTLMFNLTAALSDVKVDHTWESRFLHGASHELYSVTLPPSHVVGGLTFAEVAVMVHTQCQSAILIAIRVPVPEDDADDDSSSSVIILNPGNSYLCHGNETGYVIARDRTQADLVLGMAKDPNWGSSHSASTSTSNGANDPLVPKASLQQTAQLTPDKAVSSPTAAAIAKDKVKHLSNPTNIKRGLGARKKRTGRTIMWAASKLQETSERHKSKKMDEFVVDDVPKLHFPLKPIVVVSLGSVFPENLEFFIAPLRAPTVKDHHPIVLMSSELPSEEVFAHIRPFSDVFLVKGEPTRLGSLKRAGIEIAFKVVLLCSEEDFGTASNQLLADAVRLPLSLYDTIKFLCSPSFASGLTYSTELCDNLIINHFFNPMIKDIVRELVFSPLRESKLYPGKSKFSAFERNFAASGLQRSSLFTCELPLDFVGKSFAYCFEYLLLSDAILTLGVYRCLPPDLVPDVSPQSTAKARIERHETERAVPFGYVYLNPLASEIMTGDDLLYVLSHKQPCWA
ncbi:hypothetical protein DYB36_008554 [Aphanomyces astaci]|uniref:Uncharacterized protein n=1 Tax=Aphanomyces astaci TaxID=112090 RepID=A0A397AI01_APHAT|nr:hypothetical protein DYB36_008554 [Aphanomyces astaci]